ncbi:UMP kinase [Devosia sp. J2-20]|jgi:uridylate kinase|uniref:Uridylate kinase n=2 Tax=Devosia TaxID=46913 RepID=A0A942E646_9HYPH|nr:MULTISPECIES: UMP kinase [Devosia]MBS3848177.1 UMP kinase [Devosia litorisediminis]MCZ4345310.1 UMP kinase [Devosia neptuniae]WDQ98727.1 UMP kinase [Devosia sp. J2-20]|tara:strand:- start:1048 stop:1767 length:720 start_codon:yes stop_codon:yes gene_type:complete
MVPAYKRILLKVSGEVLAGDQSFGIEPEFLQSVAKQIADAAKNGSQIAIVIGAGNIFRGMAVAANGTDRVTADLMGMLGTVINSLALSNAIARQGIKSKVFSALNMPSVADSFTARAAKAALDEGFVVVCAGGTGNPFFTTDTAAALKAIELDCDVLLKGTKVDGVYSADPKKDPNATRYDTISYDDVIGQNLKVMDTAAFALARDNGLPIIVYALDDEAGLAGVLAGTTRSTRVGLPL